MTPLELALVAQVIAGPMVEPIPLDAALAQWEASCVSAPAPECFRIERQIEFGLYDLLIGMQRRKIEIDRAVLRSASAARFGSLARYAVTLLGRPQDDADRAANLAALDHPVPGVRDEAFRFIAEPEGERAKAIARWRTRSGQSLFPDLPADARELGLDAVPGLRFRHFASDRTRAAFTTTLGEAEVVKLLARDRPSAKLADLKAKDQAKPSPAEMKALSEQMQAAALARDAAKLMELQKRMMALMQPTMDAMPTMVVFGGVANMTIDGTYIALDGKAGPSPAPATRFAVVKREEALGETFVIFTTTDQRWR